MPYRVLMVMLLSCILATPSLAQALNNPFDKRSATQSPIKDEPINEVVPDVTETIEISEPEETIDADDPNYEVRAILNGNVLQIHLNDGSYRIIQQRNIDE